MIVGDMLPGSAVDDMTNQATVNTVLSGEHPIWAPFGGISCAYHAHVVIGQLCKAVRLSLHGAIAALRDHVSHIVRLCAKEEMCWIAARRIVARMQDPKAVWDWPIRQRPGEAMGRYFGAEKGYASVSVVSKGSVPRPTRVGIANGDHCPEALWGILEARHSLSSYTGRGVSPCRGGGNRARRSRARIIPVCKAGGSRTMEARAIAQTRRAESVLARAVILVLTVLAFLRRLLRLGTVPRHPSPEEDETLHGLSEFTKREQQKAAIARRARLTGNWAEDLFHGLPVPERRNRGGECNHG